MFSHSTKYIKGLNNASSKNEFVDVFNAFLDQKSFADDLKDGYVGTSQIEEVGDVYVARIVLAGINKSEIKLKANEGILTVQRKGEILYEISISSKIDIPSITSKLENGILCVTMPKKEVKKSVEIGVD